MFFSTCLLPLVAAKPGAFSSGQILLIGSDLLRVWLIQEYRDCRGFFLETQAASPAPVRVPQIRTGVFFMAQLEQELAHSTNAESFVDRARYHGYCSFYPVAPRSCG